MNKKSLLPKTAIVVEKIQETHSVFTLRLELEDNQLHNNYVFHPGQFNMIYLFGVGEIPISIVSDPSDPSMLDHTIRAVGRVSRGLSNLSAGSKIGLRGPYGRGWPLETAKGKDVLVITGGLGCAPVISVINFIINRRSEYGKLSIMQGVRLPADLIWRSKYEQWINVPDTEVFLAANKKEADWPWHVGLITELFDQIKLSGNTIVMMCGPEGMMRACIHELEMRYIQEENIYLSMERNMQCAVGQCGHCQYGHLFVCRNGPVFSYNEIQPYFSQTGY